MYVCLHLWLFSVLTSVPGADPLSSLSLSRYVSVSVATPHTDGELMEKLMVSRAAVCTKRQGRERGDLECQSCCEVLDIPVSLAVNGGYWDRPLTRLSWGFH